MAKQVDYNDFWYIKDNPITKAGVFPYLGKQIDPSLEPDKIYMVLRPADEIEKAKDTFKLLPLVDEHTMLGPDFTPAEQKGIHGVLGSDIKAKDGTLYSDVKIYSEYLKDEIKNGKKELSCGYFCKYDLTPGVYNGVHYDAVQRDLRGNHIALVDNGRMGHDVRVMDSFNFACDSMALGDFVRSRKSEFKTNWKLGEDMKTFDWEESKHPRDDDGKFSSGNGGGGAKGKSESAKASNVMHYKANGEKIKIEKAPNGKYFNTYGVGESPSTAGPFSTLEDAQKALKKHRPNAEQVEGKSEEGKKEDTYSSKHDPKELNEYRQRSTAASWIFEKLKPAQKKEVHEERKKIFGDKKYNRLQELLNKSYSYAYNSPEGKEERALSFEWNKAENEAVFNVAKRHGYSEEKIKEDLSNALTRLKSAGGYIEDSNDLSSKNHGNSGQDAATEKENKMDKRDIIREIMAVAAKPADQFEGGEEERERTIAELAEKIAYNPSESGANDEVIEPLKEDEEKAKDADLVKEKAEGCDEDEEEVKEAEKIDLKKIASDSMKSVLKMLGKREALYTKLTPHIGAFDHADMTEESMAKYACKKLNIAVDSGDDVCAVLKGYLKGAESKGKEFVTIAADKGLSDEKDAGFEKFLKGDK